MDMENSGSGSAYFNMTADTANDTLSCAARNIQGPVELPFNPLIPLVTRCLLVIYFMVIAFFGTALNCFVFYLVCRYKAIRTLSFVFAIQNIACNIIGSAVLVTISFMSALANKWLLGENMCIVIGVTHLAINLLRSAFLVGLVTDRFCSVFFTFSYPRFRVRVMWCLGIASYVSTAIIVIIPGVLDCYTFSNTSWICRITSTCSTKCAAFRGSNGLLVFLPAKIVPLIMYCMLYYKGRKARKSIRRSMRVAASEAHKKRKDRRATITFFWMFLSLFLIGAPPGLISFATNITGITTSTTNSLWYFFVDTFSLNVFILSHIADPIFILRNKEIREIISKIKWLPFLKVLPKNRV